MSWVIFIQIILLTTFAGIAAFLFSAMYIAFKDRTINQPRRRRSKD